MTEVKHSAAGFGAIGLAAAVIFSLAWVVAASADPSWILGSDTLSELGISDVEVAKNAFNYGCMIAGALLFIYGCGKAYRFNGAECASGILAAVAAICLALIGVFTMDHDLHLLFAITFFVLIAFSILAAGYADGKSGRSLNAAVCACVLTAAVISVAAISFPMGEAIAVAGCIAWIIADSLKLMFSRFPRTYV
jgi:hypothetical membrane protein